MKCTVKQYCRYLCRPANAKPATITLTLKPWPIPFYPQEGHHLRPPPSAYPPIALVTHNS